MLKSVLDKFRVTNFIPESVSVPGLLVELFGEEITVLALTFLISDLSLTENVRESKAVFDICRKRFLLEDILQVPSPSSIYTIFLARYAIVSSHCRCLLINPGTILRRMHKMDCMCKFVYRNIVISNYRKSSTISWVHFYCRVRWRQVQTRRKCIRHSLCRRRRNKQTTSTKIARLSLRVIHGYTDCHVPLMLELSVHSLLELHESLVDKYGAAEYIINPYLC